MKNIIRRVIQSVIPAAAGSGKRENRENDKTSKNPRGRKPTLEFLEDRSMLSAAAITFDPMPVFNYTPDSAGSEIKFDLERTSFLEIAKMKSGSNGDIISYDADRQEVSVFLSNSSTTNPGFSAAVVTPITKGKDAHYAVADMNGDNIADFIMLYTVSDTIIKDGAIETQVHLVANVYQGSSNGTFSQQPTKTEFTNPFNVIGAINSLIIDSFQVRAVTGIGNNTPDLMVSVSASSYVETASSPIYYTDTYLYTGKSLGFETTGYKTLPKPTSNKETPVGFGNFTAQSQFITEVIDNGSGAETGLRSEQTVYFYDYNASSNSMTSKGSNKYSKAYPSWTKIANVVSTSQYDQIVSGISFTNAASETTYSVRISNVTSVSPGAASVSTVRNVDVEPVYGTIGDVNGDGNMDIIVSDGTSYQIIIGNGTSDGFTAQPKVDTYANYIATAVGDFTGDGYQDVIAIGQKHVILLPGNPSHPNYSKGKVLFNFPMSATNAVFADFTGDGYLDFAISGGTNGSTIMVYKGYQNLDKPGEEVLFSRLQTFEIDRPIDLITGNFITKAGAGKSDLAILHANGTMVRVFAFDGTNYKEEYTQLGLTAVSFAAGDLNGDGYDDILTANQIAGSVMYAYNNNSGKFDMSTRKIITVGTADTDLGNGSKPCCVAFVDINNDKQLDIAVLNSGDKAVKFYYQKTDGTFPAEHSQALTISNLQTPPSKYLMEFADFDLDGRIDIIIGLTTSATHQIGVYQNKGGEPGSEFHYSELPPMTLKGTIDQKTSWGMTIGYKSGLVTTPGTPGVVIVSGNAIYRMKNTTPAESSLGAMQIVFRDKLDGRADHNFTRPDANQYDTISAIPSTATWLNEWGQYYMEVWANTGTLSEGVSSFSFSISYDPKLFRAISTNIETTDYFTLTKKTIASNVISIEGNTTNTGLGNNKYVLLARVLVTPAENTAPVGQKENVGVAIQSSGYAIPVSSNFRFVSGTSQINGKNVYTTNGAENVPVYPVLWDVNDSGRVDLLDFSTFLTIYTLNPNVNTTPESARADFNYDGMVNVFPGEWGLERTDWATFALNYEASRSSGVSNRVYSGNFPGANQLPSGAQAAQASEAAPLHVNNEETKNQQTIELFEFDRVPDNEFTVMLSGIDNVANVSPVTTDVVTTFVFANAEEFDPRFQLFTTDTAFALAELDLLGLTGQISTTQRIPSRADNIDLVLGEMYSDDDDKHYLSDTVADWYELPEESPAILDSIFAELLV